MMKEPAPQPTEEQKEHILSIVRKIKDLEDNTMKNEEKGCCRENGILYCFCGKCEPDNYPLSKDWGKTVDGSIFPPIGHLYTQSDLDQALKEQRDTIKAQVFSMGNRPSDFDHNGRYAQAIVDALSLPSLNTKEDENTTCRLQK